MMLNNPLRPNRAVPQPVILHFFQKIVEDLPLHKSTEASKRFENGLLGQVVAMLEVDLAADNYWTGSIKAFHRDDPLIFTPCPVGRGSLCRLGHWIAGGHLSL